MSPESLYVFAGGLAVFMLALQMLLMIAGLDVMGDDAFPGLDAGADVDAGDPGAAGADAAGGNLVDALGLRGVPLIIWAEAFLVSFAVAGFAQLAAFPFLPLAVTIPVAVLFGVLCARAVSRAVRRLAPSFETTSVDLSRITRIEGRVIGGEATELTPARVRLVDKHGSIHDRMLLTLNDDRIPEGTPVVALRRVDPDTGETSLRIIRK